MFFSVFKIFIFVFSLFNLTSFLLFLYYLYLLPFYLQCNSGSSHIAVLHVSLYATLCWLLGMHFHPECGVIKFL
jgi:hypothetical protein